MGFYLYFIYYVFFDFTIPQNYWVDLHAVFYFTMIGIFSQRFIAPRSVILSNHEP